MSLRYPGIVLLVPLAVAAGRCQRAHPRKSGAVLASPISCLAALPAVHAGGRLLPGEPRRALQLRHPDVARRRIDDVTISLLWGLERRRRDPLMLASPWLLEAARRVRPDRAGARLRLVRWLGFTTELPALIALQALHAGTFAACHLGAMAFLQRALPPSASRSTRRSLRARHGATQAVVFQLAGLLYADYGQRAFLGMFVVAAVRHGGVLLLARWWQGRVRGWTTSPAHRRDNVWPNQDRSPKGTGIVVIVQHAPNNERSPTMWALTAEAAKNRLR